MQINYFLKSVPTYQKTINFSVIAEMVVHCFLFVLTLAIRNKKFHFEIKFTFEYWQCLIQQVCLLSHLAYI